jgi:4-hydroxybutyryl-CoA dehydratase/vinylacetyl-CoA-Delta-isomerase
MNNSKSELMSGQDFRESLRRYKPNVVVDGRRIASVADERSLQPGINAIALTYDFAHKPEYARVMTAVQQTSGKTVNRLTHISTSSGDLLNKLEAVRLICRETGCAQRYLTHDALNAIGQVSARIDDARGTTEHTARFRNYLHRVQDADLTLGVAMTDAKGDRRLRPHEQANADSYVHIVNRNAVVNGQRGIIISGTKAIVTGAPYMHELLVMPCRNMGQEDADFAVCCAVPIDAPGLTIVARPAGRPGETPEHGAPLFSRKYGQSTGVCIFDQVFVPHDSVFYAGEWEHSGHLTYSYATHHRHTCIGARAGFGDLLIGAGALMCEANGFDPGKETHLREQMVELITITESFFACGVAASVYGKADEHSKTFMPDPVFSNIGKLLLATRIYDMHRIAHYVSGGLIVTLPGPDEDHNPETAARLSEVLRANPDVPYEQRIETARFIEDLTAGYQGGWYSVISLHGGGSPAAMKQEIYRNYPIGSKVELVERILERGIAADGSGPRPIPAKPIRYIVPVAAGGGSDMVGRVVTERWGKVLGQSFVVDNQSGGGGVVACQPPAAPRPMATPCCRAMWPPTAPRPATRKVPYDAVKDFTPIGMIGATPNVLVVNANACPSRTSRSSWTTWRKQPRRLSYGSAGPGLAHAPDHGAVQAADGRLHGAHPLPRHCAGLHRPAGRADAGHVPRPGGRAAAYALGPRAALAVTGQAAPPRCSRTCPRWTSRFQGL